MRQSFAALAVTVLLIANISLAASTTHIVSHERDGTIRDTGYSPTDVYGFIWANVCNASVE